MTFKFTYCQEAERIIPAVEIAARIFNPQISGQVGSVIKAFNDSLVAGITASVLLYKIETATGNLCGYFTLQTSGSAAILMRSTFRPAFQQFSVQLLSQIAKFITDGTWKFDTP